jgi:hypothetical protein
MKFILTIDVSTSGIFHLKKVFKTTIRTATRRVPVKIFESTYKTLPKAASYSESYQNLVFLKEE